MDPYIIYAIVLNLAIWALWAIKVSTLIAPIALSNTELTLKPPLTSQNSYLDLHLYPL